MIKLLLVGGGTWWVNPDYIVELTDEGDGTCLVVQDHPDGVVVKHVNQTARAVANQISFNS